VFSLGASTSERIAPRAVLILATGESGEPPGPRTGLTAKLD
jgi:hypothetical protein